MSFRIFISHRFQDAPIADVVRHNLQDWGIPGECIYQAGRKDQGAEPGKPIGDQLIEAIRATDLFIMVFTLADEDWSYCMFEQGIATGADTKPTNVIVFQCTDHMPRVRQDHLTVKVKDPESVKDFVIRFHKDPDFRNPDEASRDAASAEFSFLARTDDQVIERRGEGLHDALSQTIYYDEPKATEHLEYLHIRADQHALVEVSNLRERIQLEAIDDPESSARLRTRAIQMIRENLTVTENSSRAGLRLFGLSGAPCSLDQVIECWRNEYCIERNIKEVPAADRHWIPLLLGNIMRCFAGIVWKPNNETIADISSESTNRYLALVTRTFQKSYGDFEFNLYLAKAPYEQHIDSYGENQLLSFDEQQKILDLDNSLSRFDTSVFEQASLSEQKLRLSASSIPNQKAGRDLLKSIRVRNKTQ